MTTQYVLNAYPNGYFSCTGHGPEPGSAGNPHRPVAFDSEVLIDLNQESRLITLWASDPNGDPTSFSIANSPTKGTLGPIGDVSCSGGVPNVCTATVVYTPSGATGGDSFTYSAWDGHEYSLRATIKLPSFFD